MFLTQIQLDTFKELINIGVGRAAAMLNEMLSSEIILNVPFIEVDYLSNLLVKLEAFANKNLSNINLSFDGNFSGNIKLLIAPEEAAELVSLLTGEMIGSYELDSISVGTLNEVGNIVLNSILGSISNAFSTRFDFSLPVYSQDTLVHSFEGEEELESKVILLSHTEFEVANLAVKGEILLSMELKSFNQLKLELDKLHG